MNEWEIREFYGEESLLYEKLTAAAFHYPLEAMLDVEKFKQHMIEDDAKRRADVTELYHNAFTRYGAFLDGRLVSALKCFAFVVNFDGNRCEMGGIGGVASDPELRRTGGVTRLMRHALSDMHAKGQIFSHLAPFKTSFYQKYGYEHVASAIRWTIPIGFLPQGGYTGLSRYEGTEEEIREIKRLYREHTEKYNLAVERSDARWESSLNRFRTYAGKTFCYFHRTNGVADGFMAYTVKEHEKEPMDVAVSELWFTDVSALRAFLSYLGSMSSYAQKATLVLPADTDLAPMLTEMQSAYGKELVTREILCRGATRVVDAEAVLRLAAYRGTGEARIRISDPICPRNDRAFLVRFEDGRATRVDACEECDAEMTIGAFSVMILGGAEIDQAPYFEGITVHGNMENLRKIFYKKRLWIEDSF